MSVDRALFWYAWDSPGSFALVDKLSVGEDLVLALVNEGMDDEGLLKRVSMNLFADELFMLLVNVFKGTHRWPTFVRAVINVPRACWASSGGGLSEDVVVKRFFPLLDGTSLQELIRVVENDRSHPLFDRLFADPFWTARVCHYIAKRDHLRAWEEIKKAKRGMSAANITPRNRRERERFGHAPEGLYIRASTECQRALAIRLFETMVERKLIEPLKGGDYVILRKRTHGIAGLTLALRLGDVEESHVPNGKVKYSMCRVGAIALKLARNFARPGAGKPSVDALQAD